MGGGVILLEGRVRPGANAIILGLFATALAAVMALAMWIVRSGFPTPLFAVTVGPSIVAVCTLLPALWAGTDDDRQSCIGPLTVVALLLCCLLALLGFAGIAIVWIVAVVATAAALARAAEGLGLGALRWLALLLVAGALAVIHVHGNKYFNFLADQLLLYGRTDGDVMFHGAILNAFRYFQEPSTGVDGIRLLHYHAGLPGLAGALAAGANLSAVLALCVFRAEILFPLAPFALGWAAQTFGRRLLPDLAIGAWPLAAVSVAVFLLAELGTLAGLGVPNDPMLLSGIVFALLLPALFTLGTEPERPISDNPAWWLAVLATPLLCALKISTGYLWAAVAGYWVLRLIGPKRTAFWILGIAIGVLFLGSYWLFTASGGGNTVLFGTPLIVERGFAKGKYWVPLLFHVHAILAFIVLWAIRHRAERRPLRLFAEALGVAVLVANLPGLLMQIGGGDAVFFLRALGWMAAPIVVLGIVVWHASLGTAATKVRALGWTVATLVTLGLIADAATYMPTRANIVIAGAALLHSGDRTYYAGDSIKTWRVDAKRARREKGLTLIGGNPPEPTGASLARALQDFRAEFGTTGAAYIPPQSDYWDLVMDCDGRSLWPMAAVGIPLIDGYVPVQSACAQRFSVSGYGTPPETRQDLPDAALCQKALADGFSNVLRIESLGDRTRDRRLSCH
jgi:hypothetical protein